MAIPFSPGNHVVYIADSVPEHRRAMAALLRRAGYWARSFPSAEALLAGVDKRRPACVITEITLPDMSAAEMTRSLRSRDCLAPVIVLTGEDDVALAVEALRSSVADYLTRPFAERDLINRLRVALTRGHAPTH